MEVVVGQRRIPAVDILILTGLHVVPDDLFGVGEQS
jgi:hypothetical protein